MKQYERLSVSILRFDAQDVVTASAPWRGPGFSKCGCLIAHCKNMYENKTYEGIHENCDSDVHDCGVNYP